MRTIPENLVSLLGFMLPLIANELLFCVKEGRREQFTKRLVLSAALYALCAMGIMILLTNQLMSAQNFGMYFAVFAASFGLILLCFDISVIEAIFITSCGYALQHMGYSIYVIIRQLSGMEGISLIKDAIYNVIVQLIVTAAVYLVLIRKMAYEGERRERDPRMVALAVTMLICTIGLSVWCSMNETGNTPENQTLVNLICKFYAVICCILIISMEYAVSHMNVLAKQKEFMEQLVHTQANQLQMSQENISIINRKCHDIKYQMKALRLMDNSETRKEYIDELKKAISIYDSVYHTGNEALNLLLREKTLLCDEYEIQFSCMAEGHCLSFIATDDLYVLLGNALDNAIESVLREEDKDKRIISVNIGERKGLRCIHIENHCKEDLQFRNGLPVTSKKDKEMHGFGTQSIKYLAEKYHGSLVMQQLNDMFYLDIFFAK